MQSLLLVAPVMSVIMFLWGCSTLALGNCVL